MILLLLFCQCAAAFDVADDDADDEHHDDNVICIVEGMGVRGVKAVISSPNICNASLLCRNKQHQHKISCKIESRNESHRTQFQHTPGECHMT